MAHIEIPFSYEMAIAAANGWKIATTRSERKGEIGDTFIIPYPRDDEFYEAGDACEFRIIDVFQIHLRSVKAAYHRLEGCSSPEEFEKLWRSLHRGHFTEDKVYWIHFFARCP